MLSALLLIIPIVFSAITFLIKGEQAKKIALGASIIEMILGLVIYCQFSPTGGMQFETKVPWIPAFGISFHLGIDGISMMLVLLTSILTPFIIFSSFNTSYKNPSAFYGLILLMQAGLTGVFISMDGFLFYVFYELALIPIYFICGIWGGERRIPVTLKFFIYTLGGSLFMLLALIYLYFKTPGDHTFEIQSFYNLNLSGAEQSWIFWAFFLAFAIKIPIFPFHTWQPETYTTAPSQGTMLLAGIMLKMGIYGLIRFVLPIVPQGVDEWNTVAMVLCVTGIVYASIIAIRQNDLKMLIAYSSIAHVGLIAAGVLSGNIQGMQGAMIQMFNHGVNVVAIFFMIDHIEKQTGTRLISSLGGIANSAPKLAVFFMIVMLGSVGLPLTNGFIGEFLLLFGFYQYNPIMAAVAGLTIILGAVYMFRLYKNVFMGEVNVQSVSVLNPSKNDYLILIPLAALVIFIGVYPAVLQIISEHAAQNILSIFHTPNPAIGKL